MIADPPAGNLNTSSAIYIVRSNLQRLYTITSPNIGLVVQPGVSLSGDLAPGGIVVDVSATRYLWLEGDFRLPNDLGAIRLNGTSYARVHNVRIDAGGQVATWGLRMTGASNNRIDHFTFSGQGDFGIRLEAAANYNTLFDIKRSNGWQSLVQLNASDNNIVVGFLTTSVNSNAMAQTSGNRNIFLNGASIFASDGFYGGAGQLSLVNFVAAANGADGINFINASKSTVADAVSSHNQGNGVIVSNNNTFEYFTGILEFASNGSSHCTGDLTRGIRNGCGFDELSDYSLAFGADLTSSFVGSVSSDDSANTTAMDGSGRTVGPISDPWNFENRFRAWGKDAGAFPGVPGNLGLCTTNCRLWDFSLRNGDTRLRNRFGIPN
ncbi:MAG: hypothetical protein KDK34_06745, partial [Leptospiraceae bacterium]|nr:hypothetical protein [Leptospiraceae bacterium]